VGAFNDHPGSCWNLISNPDDREAMNVCLFTPSFLPDTGGMEVVIDRLAREFQQRGHHPTVVAQRSRRNPTIPDLPYETIYYSRPRLAVWLLHLVKHVLLREHMRHHFDMVHAHMAYPNGYMACVLRHRLGVPVVITSHKSDIIPQSRYRQRWIPNQRMCWALQVADAVTAVSSERKGIVDEMSRHRANSLVIPNDAALPPDSPGLIPDLLAGRIQGNFMLTLGRLHHYKGIDVLIDALKQIRDHGPEVPPLVLRQRRRFWRRIGRTAAALHRKFTR
jgi:glycosyltransferase involved in cell wall biosynthesis